MLRKKPAILITLLISMSINSCGTDPETLDRDADEQSDADVERESDADGESEVDGDSENDDSGICSEPERLVFATTDYTTGAAGLLSLADWSSQPSLITLHSDTVVTCSCGVVVALERLGGDNLTILSPEDLSLIDQHPLGPRSNPYDAWFAGNIAYVSLYGDGKVVAVDINDGEILDEVDLSSLADDDGKPESAMLHHYNGALYIAIQLLDENTTLWDPTGPGLLAVVSLDPFELTGTIQLEGVNPTTDLVVGEQDSVIYLGHSGDWSVVDDGGIERVNLETEQSEGIIVEAKELGGNIIDFVIVAPDLGYATVNIPNDRDNLVSFDPSSGTVINELASSDPYSLVDLLLDGNGHMVVADRAVMSVGLRIFDAVSGQELFSEPINTVIPPFSMCLVPELQ